MNLSCKYERIFRGGPNLIRPSNYSSCCCSSFSLLPPQKILNEIKISTGEIQTGILLRDSYVCYHVSRSDLVANGENLANLETVDQSFLNSRGIISYVKSI